MSPPMASRVLEEETVTALSVAFPGMENEPPNGGMAEETGQPMQGVQTTQDPEASRLLALKVLSLRELPIRSEPCFLKHCQVKRLREACLYPNKQVSRISLYNSVLSLFLFCSPFFFLSPFFLSFFFPFSF